MKESKEKSSPKTAHVQWPLNPYAVNTFTHSRITTRCYMFCLSGYMFWCSCGWTKLSAPWQYAHDYLLSDSIGTSIKMADTIFWCTWINAKEKKGNNKKGWKEKKGEVDGKKQWGEWRSAWWERREHEVDVKDKRQGGQRGIGSTCSLLFTLPPSHHEHFKKELTTEAWHKSGCQRFSLTKNKGVWRTWKEEKIRNKE